VKIRRRRERHFPGASAASASDPPASARCHRPAFNLEGLAIEQCVSDSSVSTLKDSAERGARDVHLDGCLFLLITLKIGEADGFELIQRKNDELERRHWHALGLEC